MRLKRQNAMAKFEIQTFTLFGGWVNCWERDGEKEYFDTLSAAVDALEEFFEDQEQAYFNGEIEDLYDREDYRIRTVKEGV